MDDLEKIKKYFLDVFKVELSDILLSLLIEQADVIFAAYKLTTEQRQLCLLLYVGCQLSSPPLFLIPPSAMLTAESVRDFSVSYAPLAGIAEEGGYCGQLKKILKTLGYRNGSVSTIIVR